MAKDIKRLNPNSKIYGVDTNTSHLEEALALDLIDVKSSYDDLNLANIVIVGIPVDVMITELPKILGEVMMIVWLWMPDQQSPRYVRVWKIIQREETFWLVTQLPVQNFQDHQQQ